MVIPNSLSALKVANQVLEEKRKRRWVQDSDKRKT